MTAARLVLLRPIEACWLAAIGATKVIDHQGNVYPAENMTAGERKILGAMVIEQLREWGDAANAEKARAELARIYPGCFKRSRAGRRAVVK